MKKKFGRMRSILWPVTSRIPDDVVVVVIAVVVDVVIVVGGGVGVDPGLGGKKSNSKNSFLALVKSTNPTAPRPSVMLSVKRIKQIL